MKKLLLIAVFIGLLGLGTAQASDILFAGHSDAVTANNYMMIAATCTQGSFAGSGWATHPTYNVNYIGGRYTFKIGGNTCTYEGGAYLQFYLANDATCSVLSQKIGEKRFLALVNTSFDARFNVKGVSGGVFGKYIATILDAGGVKSVITCSPIY